MIISNGKVFCMLDAFLLRRSAVLHRLCWQLICADCACCKSRAVRVGVWVADVPPPSLHTQPGWRECTLKETGFMIIIPGFCVIAGWLAALVGVFMTSETSHIQYYNLRQNRHVSHKIHNSHVWGEKKSFPYIIAKDILVLPQRGFEP